MGVLNAVARLTRSSYRRKIITIGVSVFAAVALMATGFASWVLSSNANAPSEGGLQVGVVQEANIEISVTGITGGAGDNHNEFAFEPLATDLSGKVKYGGEGTVSEALAITVTATIKNVQSVGKVYVDITLPAGVQKAIDEGYVTLVSPASRHYIVGTESTIGDATKAASATLANDGYEYSYDSASGLATLKYVVKLGWGAKFGGMNPGLYYDDPSQPGYESGVAEISETLGTMKALMHNTTWDVYKALSLDDQQKADLGKGDAYRIGNYTFTIYADVK